MIRSTGRWINQALIGERQKLALVNLGDRSWEGDEQRSPLIDTRNQVLRFFAARFPSESVAPARVSGVLKREMRSNLPPEPDRVEEMRRLSDEAHVTPTLHRLIR